MNYALALRLSGRTDWGINQLEALEKEHSDDYRILMYIALFSYEQQDDGKASVYCRKALDAWDADNSGEKESLQSENRQHLMNLAEKYGIRRD